MKDLKIFLKQTVYYGLSSVIARVLNFLLVPLYTYIFIPEQYGIISEMYAYAVFIMILSTLSIETAFFKFSNKPTIKDNVASNSSFLLLVSSTILILLAIFFVDPISKIIGGTQFTDYRNYIFYFLIILSVDTLCVIPFAQLRLKERARRFATVKVINILVNILFNLYFYLYLGYTKIDYVFISNLLSSIVTFLILAPSINNFSFDLQLSKKMMKYSFPLIIAGFAYAVNETADKILIKNLTNQNPLEQLGIYSACYKLSIFMILFIQAFRLAAEPLFFNYQKKTNSKKITTETYAQTSTCPIRYQFPLITSASDNEIKLLPMLISNQAIVNPDDQYQNPALVNGGYNHYTWAELYNNTTLDDLNGYWYSHNNVWGIWINSSSTTTGTDLKSSARFVPIAYVNDRYLCNPTNSSGTGTSGSGKTGDINLTTTGHASGDSYVIVLTVIKTF